MVYDRIGRVDDAREAFRQAVRLNVDASTNALQKLPEFGQPWAPHLLIAQFYYRHDENSEAIEVLKQAASFFPDSDDVHISLSTMYLALGDKFSALIEYNTLKDKTKEDARVLLERIEKSK
jgi:Flp pilus assembly protein TadD